MTIQNTRSDVSPSSMSLGEQYPFDPHGSTMVALFNPGWY